MAKKIQVKRGNAANLPTLAPGELGLTVDTKKLYVGHEQGNVPLAMEGELCNPNLLINGGFDVWQKGTSFTEFGYTADRWTLSGNLARKTEKIENGIKLTATSSGKYIGIHQFVKLTPQMIENFTGKTVTMSFRLRTSMPAILYGTNIPLTGNSIISSTRYKTYSFTGSFYYLEDENAVQCSIGAALLSDNSEIPKGFTIEIEWVKLELGSITTSFSAKDYVKELRDCLWYDGDIVRAPYCNQNLLDNADFRNKNTIVNQRGIESYPATTEFGYFFDRWKGLENTVIIKDGYLNIKSNKGNMHKIFIQFTENMLEKNKIYTISMMARVNEISGDVRISPCDSDYHGLSGVDGLLLSASSDFRLYTYTFTVSSDYQGFGIEVFAYNSANDYFDIDITSIKLEKGAVSTILSDLPQDYGVELAKCQRYFRKLNKSYSLSYLISDGKSGTFQLDVENMRINPTIRFPDTDFSPVYNITTGGNYQVSEYTILSSVDKYGRVGFFTTRPFDMNIRLICPNVFADANL